MSTAVGSRKDSVLLNHPKKILLPMSTSRWPISDESFGDESNQRGPNMHHATVNQTTQGGDYWQALQTCLTI